MPDESCRKCGGLLLEYAFCGKCRTSIQLICRICSNKTIEQFHDSLCFNIVNHDEVLTRFPMPSKVEIARHKIKSIVL